MIGVAYSGFSGISGKEVSIATKQCSDSDGVDIFTPGTCGDDYNIVHDYCNVQGNAVLEYSCSGFKVCTSQLIACGEGYKCRSGEGYCIEA